MRSFLLIFLALPFLLLIACDMAGRGFAHAPVTRVTADDLQFSIRFIADTHGYRGEAIRTNTMLRPQMEHISLISGAAMEQLTGCTLRQIGGDVAVQHARLKCLANDAPASLTIGGSYRCTLTENNAPPLRCRRLNPP